MGLRSGRLIETTHRRTRRLKSGQSTVKVSYSPPSPLQVKHLGQTLAQMQPTLHKLVTRPFHTLRLECLAVDLETDPQTRVRNPCPKSETSLLYSPGAGDLD
jgi:hypothetical protein